MTIRSATLWSCGIAVALSACGASPQAPAPPVAPPAAPRTEVPAATIQQAKADWTMEPARYDARGRRDPFEALDTVQAGGRGPSVASAKLTGIVRGTDSRLALVETADGIGYILQPGAVLGEGRLVEIGSDKAVFTLTPKPGFPPERLVLTLASD